MNSQAPRRSATRIVLISVLVVALLVLAGVAVVLTPILTHKSAGGSGQVLPTDFVSQVTAEGADGRTRSLRAETLDGKPADLANVQPGEELVISGTGFDAGIGIYVAFCAIPESAERKPFPCLGGIPEGAQSGAAAGQEMLASAWITSDWAWKAFATESYDDTEAGTFSVRLAVPESSVEGLDCSVQKCAITTRADHTAAKDRVQDLLLPIHYN